MLYALTSAYSRKDFDNQQRGLLMQTNIGKLFSVFAWGLNIVQEQAEKIRQWDDLDNAKGSVLDRYGANFGVKRNGTTDDFYRLEIRVKVMSQLSGGDDDTVINAAAELLGVEPTDIELEDDFPAKKKMMVNGLIIPQERQKLIDQISADIKRLLAAGVGFDLSLVYIFRNAIKIGTRLDLWSYRVPECGTIRCGTWWMRHTLGWSERHRLAVSGRVVPVEVSPELSGTLPYAKTPGYSLRGELRIAGQATGHPAQPQFAGLIQSGTEWMRRTLGWSEQAGALTEGARPEGFAIAPEFAGTLPEQSSKGYTFVCGAVRSGGVATAFMDRPKEAGEPEKTGTWPETTTVGHSMAAGTVHAGGGAEIFKTAPEVAGTLPEVAVDGYAITGSLSARADVEGRKITPEYTGTLSKEAQHGERNE